MHRSTAARAVRGRWTRIRRVAALGATLVLVASALAVTLSLHDDAAANVSANLDQCANGGEGDPIEVCTGGNWQNGNLNSNQAQYIETSSVPFRLRLGGLSTSPATHTVVLEWDTTHSANKHTYDYLTTYDQTEAGADPCSGVASCNPAVFTTFPIPADGNIPADPNWTGTQIPGNFTLFGGTITGLSAYTLSGSYTSGSASETQLTITFTADVVDPVLAWAGHIASQDDWGAGHAAADIAGSPYHMRVLDVDGSGGNQDRSLSVVTPQNGIRIIKDSQPDAAQDFDFTISGPGPDDTFTLDDDADPALSDTHTLTGLTPGTYTVTEDLTPGWAVTSITCVGGTTSVDPATRSATITLNGESTSSGAPSRSSRTPSPMGRATSASPRRGSGAGPSRSMTTATRRCRTARRSSSSPAATR